MNAMTGDTTPPAEDIISVCLMRSRARQRALETYRSGDLFTAPDVTPCFTPRMEASRWREAGRGAPGESGGYSA